MRLVPLALVLSASLAAASAARAADGPACMGDCQPDGPAACDVACNGAAVMLYQTCVDAGGDAARDACRRVGHAVYDACATTVCGRTIDDTDCRTHCMRRGDEVAARCTAAGKPQAVCDTMAAAASDACIRDECIAPVAGCADGCADTAATSFAACAGAGSPPAECAGDVDSALGACVAAQCADGAGDDGGGSEDCTARCAQAASDAAAACTAAGVPADRCQARADEMARHCAEEHCGAGDDGEEGDDDASCAARCDLHAQEVVTRCLADGGEPTACEGTGAAAYDACVAMHCRPDAHCTGRCDQKAARLLRRCMRHGDDAASCQSQADDLAAACEADHCAPPPPDTCASGCDDAAAAARAQCLAQAGDEATCDDAASSARETCLTGCDAGDDGTCRQQCEQTAASMRDRAREHHVAAGRADRKARKAFRRCAAACGDQ